MTQVPMTQASMTQASMTQAPMTQAPMTQAPVTQAPVTQAPMTETDPREIHQRAMAQTELIVAAVEPGQLTLPTPCADYDVGALLSHIVGGLNRIALMGEGADAMAAPPPAEVVG
jgi:Mycothiol maleylpyruvate isomerase N-terminal domain